MFRNYLTIALRNLRRHKGYTAINVLGLAVGMAACLLIGLYVEDELSYDAFHANADRIVAVGTSSDFMGTSRATPFPLAATLQSELPAVHTAVRTVGDATERTVRLPEESYSQPVEVLTADSAFFDVFSFPLLRGTAETALDAPNQTVLTESTAETFFGAADPMGRTLTLQIRGKPIEVTVAGVARDLPTNSTIQFEMVLPMNAYPLRDQQRKQWGMLMFHTYAQLNQPVKADTLSAAMMEALGPRIEKFPFQFSAVPLTDLYLSEFVSAEGFSGQWSYSYLFGSIALLILLIAAINYVNLITAQAEQRAGEVGVRKTMGARRQQVMSQFLGETALVSGVALVIALVLLVVALPGFNALFQKELTLWASRHLWALLGLVGFVLVVTVAAGAYPAFVLSGFEPVRVLRGASASSTSSGGWLRKGLVVTQFAVSAGLILGTIVIYQQLNYVQTKNLGFDGEQVVTVTLDDASEERQRAVKQEVLGHPDVQRAALGSSMPGGFGIRFSQKAESISPAESTESENVEMRPAKVDPEYIETLGLELITGRSFSRERATDRTQAYILNEAAARAMGWTATSAVGKPFTFGRGTDAPEGTVIGVVQNFHVESLKSEIAPVVLQMDGARFSSDPVLAAKLSPGGIPAAMDHIESAFNDALPGASFTYTFLDDQFDQMYRSERRLAWIFSMFAGIAIVIACMGLFGLAAFAAERRTKEIGVRKALGASLADVIGLLSKEFAALVGVALVVGAPLAYWGMQRWLQDFAYRVEIGPGAFVGTAVVALLIAGASISYHAVRAARTDPATALRYE
jgi:putative ABC transport system permease protein